MAARAARHPDRVSKQLNQALFSWNVQGYLRDRAKKESNH